MKAGRGPGPEAALGLWPPAGKGIGPLEKGPFQAARLASTHLVLRCHRQLSRGICLEKTTLSGLLPHFCSAGSVHWVLKQVTRVLNSLKAGWGGVEGFRRYHISPGHANSCRVRPFLFARTPSHVGSAAPVALTLLGGQLQPPVRTVNSALVSAPAKVQHGTCGQDGDGVKEQQLVPSAWPNWGSSALLSFGKIPLRRPTRRAWL